MADEKVSFLKKKYGPWPGWVWALLIVAALIVLSSINKNKKAGDANQQKPRMVGDATLTAPPVTLIQEGFSGPPNNQSAISPNDNNIEVNGRIPNLTNYTGYKYTVKPGDTFDSIISQFYGDSANKDITERIVAADNSITWNEAAHSYTPLQPGQALLLTPNGIVNVQNNTLSRYDSGHGIDSGGA